jgi:hypothetical protein
MESKYYKKYLKYKNKYALLKNSYNNEMYAQLGGNPDPTKQFTESHRRENLAYESVPVPPKCTTGTCPVMAAPKPVLRASP